MDHASDSPFSLVSRDTGAGDSSTTHAGDRGHTDRLSDWTSRFLSERPMSASSRYSGGEGRAGGIPLE